MPRLEKTMVNHGRTDAMAMPLLVIFLQNASGTARYETVCAGCMSLSVCENCTVDNSDYNPICSAVPEHTFADKPGTRLEALRIEEGYWRATRESAIILSCYNEAACLGGQTGAETFCKTGYTGACE